jgi:acetyl esterase/lipase
MLRLNTLRRQIRAGTTVITVAVALGALATVNGYRSITKTVLSIPSYVIGSIITELPVETIAVEATALSLATRRLPRPMRKYAWMLSAVSWLGRLGLRTEAAEASQPLSAALDDGLGQQRRKDSAGLWGDRAPGGATAKAPALLRMIRVRRDYNHDGDISYGPHGAANHLDIWRRPDLARTAGAPVLLQVPGGAWASGNKRGQAYPLMSHLAANGWICVSINYRLSPRHTWPVQIVDVKAAICWVKVNIERYGGDPTFIAVTGGSAGGHLSALAALTANRPEFQPGFETVDTVVQAAVPFYGVYDLTRTDDALNPFMVPFLEKLVIKQRRTRRPDLFESASPISYCRPDAPPFFVLHGRNDSFIPVEQARSFTAKLRSISTEPVAYAELPRAQHAFDIAGSARAGHAAVAVEQFLAEIYSRRSTDQRERA